MYKDPNRNTTRNTKTIKKGKEVERGKKKKNKRGQVRRTQKGKAKSRSLGGRGVLSGGETKKNEIKESIQFKPAEGVEKVPGG